MLTSMLGRPGEDLEIRTQSFTNVLRILYARFMLRLASDRASVKIAIQPLTVRQPSHHQ
jgi:hypothetical protein